MILTRVLGFGVLTILGASPPLAARQTNGHGSGRVVGRVLDAVYGTPISGAQVRVGGTTLSATTGVDGRYTLLNVPAEGALDVRVRMIGYAPKTVSGLMVPRGGVIEQDITLSAEVFQLAEITVTAAAERGTVTTALDEIRSAPTIMSSLPAQLIRRTPDGDAGQAVQRVAGVTVQDGKYVFVRGLGERYTTTALNGARIPSAEPEKKVVPLDLFPSGLLEGITTSKTFTPDQPGDFSGAQVNLKTREFPLGRALSFSASVGANQAATGRSVLKAPTAGPEWLGFSGSARALPASVAAAGTLMGQSPAQVNQLIASFRDVWTAREGTGSANGGFSMSLGGEDPVAGQLIGYIGSLTYSYGQEIRADERKALAVQGTRPGELLELNGYRGQTARSSVTWGGLLNLSTRIGASSKISLSNTVTRSGDNEASRMAGFNEGFNQQLELTRLTFTEWSVRSNQVAGTHLFGQRHTVEWSGTSAAVTRVEPDRSDLAYIARIDSASWAVTPLEWFGAPRSASRTFGDIREHTEEGALSYRLAIGDPARQFHVKLGGYGKQTQRDADSRMYDIINAGLTQGQRVGAAEAILTDQNAVAGNFLMAANSGAGRYDASDKLVAGYLQLEVPLGDRLRVIGGARVERSRIAVNSQTIELGVSQARLRNTDLLPSISLHVKASQTHSVRLSASQTLSRPEYRELSPVTYFDILGGQKLFGNRDLKRALIQNYDARWEWYPGRGETVSLAVFAKRFQRPIERILVQTSDAFTPDVTFVNALSARNYGVELELRRSLGMISETLAPLTAFANATLMKSQIRPGNEGISSLTNARRPMVGQSEYVVNAGVGYSSSDGRFTATALYNVAGLRIFEAGIFPLPDSYEQPRHLVDFSLQLPLMGSASLKLDAKNLLDSPFRLTQGPVERVSYRTGRIFSAGVSWKP